MRATRLLENLQFHDNNPYAQPLYVADDGRVIRFTLRPGQTIAEHDAPSSPFFVVVLRGRGQFAGSDGVMQTFGPNDLLIFDAGEKHTVQALDEEFVFVGILHGVAGARPGKVGGLLGDY